MYSLLLSDSDLQALDFIAARYTYAEVLRDALEEEYAHDGERVVGHFIAEHDAWAFQDAVEAEDGFLTLAGGTLLDAMLNLLNEIV